MLSSNPPPSAESSQKPVLTNDSGPQPLSDGGFYPLRQVVQRLDQLYPTRYAESWDNVGLLVGEPEQPIRSILLTIDFTPDVAREAQALGSDLVIAYHPPIFEPLKRVDGLIYDTIRQRRALYSPHTAADVSPGGTNDFLAEVLGLSQVRPLKPASLKPRECKLVTFVPEEAVEKVSSALFSAGAGWIGNYSSCSYRSVGTGTFYGEPGTLPAVGQSGRLEQVTEIRLETVVPLPRVEAVVAALRQAHPYEEPAFDLVSLGTVAGPLGLGRVGVLEPTPRTELLARIKTGLNVGALLVSGPIEGEVTRAAVGAGACGNLINDALSARADLYLTGELRHHDALKAAHAGMTVVCVLHSNSERAWLSRLKQQLLNAFPSLSCELSQSDRDPFSVL